MVYAWHAQLKKNMKTEDLLKIKNQLLFAIIQTFDNAGVDPHAGKLILEAVLYEFDKPMLDQYIGRDLVLKEENEELHSS